MHVSIARVNLEKSVSKIAVDLQAWPAASSKAQPGFAVDIEAEGGTFLLPGRRGFDLGEPTNTQQICCQGPHSSPITRCCLKCSENLRAKETPPRFQLRVFAGGTYLRQEPRCLHASEQAKRFMPQVGEPETLYCLWDNQSLKLKHAAEVLRMHIFADSVENMPRRLTCSESI